MVTSGDVPALCVVSAGYFIHIIRYPLGEIVVADIKEAGNAVRTAHHVYQQSACILLGAFHQSAVMVIQVEDFLHLSAHQIMEGTLLQQSFSQIGRTGCGKPYTHVIKLVDVLLQILFGEVARYAGKVIKHPLPVYVPYFRQFQKWSNFFTDCQEGDV